MNYIYVIIAYLIGSIPFSLILGKLFKKTDLRKFGSGNVGSTNAARVLGYKIGLITLVLDISKGFFPTYIASMYDTNLAVYVGLFSILGHCYSIYLRFRGGKAVATTIGVYLALAPYSVLIGLLVFFIVFISTKYVAISSMCLAISIAISTYFFNYDSKVVMLAILIAVIIIIRHKSNIINLINNKEAKFISKDK